MYTISNENNFKITLKLKELKNALEKALGNIPNKYKEDRKNINNLILEYLKKMYIQNYIDEINKRGQLLKETTGILDTIKWNINYLKEKLVISDKDYISIGKTMEDINKMHYGIIKYVNKIKENNGKRN